MKDEKIPLPKAFMTFHKAHPEVYRELRTMALQLRALGHRHYGIKSLFEVVRWQGAIKINNFKGYKMNNNYTAFYARMLMKNEPALRGFFFTRSSIAGE